MKYLTLAVLRRRIAVDLRWAGDGGRPADGRALAIYIAWWIVGGRAGAKGFFTSFSYFSGALMVVGAGYGLFEWSIVKVFEPERFEKVFVRRPGSEQIKMMFDPVYATRIIGEPSATWYVVVGLDWAFALLFLMWIIVAWGAFRTLSKAGRGKQESRRVWKVRRLVLAPRELTGLLNPSQSGTKLFLMRINIWIVRCSTRALGKRYQSDTQRICVDDPSASVCGR